MFNSMTLYSEAYFQVFRYIVQKVKTLLRASNPTAKRAYPVIIVYKCHELIITITSQGKDSDSEQIKMC